MVFLKLEKLSVLESGILFIAAVIITIIILFLLLFLMICRTSRGPHELALACLISALWTCPLAPGPVAILSSLCPQTPHSPFQHRCFTVAVSQWVASSHVYKAQLRGDILKVPLLDHLLQRCSTSPPCPALPSLKFLAL